MRIRAAGPIGENLWMLGREESCVYLLKEGDEAMLISGGMGYLVPVLLNQFAKLGIEESKITKLLILHSHFDHVGVVPFFKRRNPNLEIFGSARAWEILGTPKFLNTINQFGREVAKRKGMEKVCARYDIEWREDIQGKTVAEGDKICIGELEILIFETPGHSSCAISAYEPRLKALFASDSGGIPYKDTIIASGNSNYTAYQKSLTKLKDLEVAVACADHYGYIIGDEAQSFIQKAIVVAKERRAMMESLYRRTGDIDATVEKLVNSFYLENTDYLLTREIFRGVYRQMVRHIVREMDAP